MSTHKAVTILVDRSFMMLGSARMTMLESIAASSAPRVTTDSTTHLYVIFPWPIAPFNDF